MPTSTSQTSRRHFLTSAASIAAAATLVRPFGLFAQTTAAAPATDRLAVSRAGAANAKITTQTLRGNVSVLMGSGGNIAVLTGKPDSKTDAEIKPGKLIVDSGYSTSQPQIAAALAAINADPLATLVNTHWHFDHTDGNEWVHAAGATIHAHEKTLQRLSTPQRIAAFDMNLPAAPAGALPTIVFKDEKTLHVNQSTLVMKHYAPAHTDTDILIHFLDADILHTGDTWFNGIYPFIDYSSGGNIDGMIAAAKQNISIAGPNTAIIPGHGPVGNQTELAAWSDMLVQCRGKVADLKKQGKTLAEVQAAKPTAAFDAKYGGGFMNGDAFTGLVYQGV